MDTAEVKLLYDFNYGAKGRIFSAASRVSPERYAVTTPFGIGSPIPPGVALPHVVRP